MYKEARECVSGPQFGFSISKYVKFYTKFIKIVLVILLCKRTANGGHIEK